MGNPLPGLALKRILPIFRDQACRQIKDSKADLDKSDSLSAIFTKLQ
jgi:hypothetical protein